MPHKPNFHLFTGGPGVGKTTLLRHLQALGERVVPETARAVIREAAAAGRPAINITGPARFARLCAARDIANFDALAHETGRVFFDRGVPDSYGANGAPPWPGLEAAIAERRYNARVFVFPPWREIYETDTERTQDWPEAERTFGLILSVLPTLGYEPVIVPTGTVEERATFVLAIAT